MLKKLAQAEEKWGGESRLIDRWLQTRRELLIQYFKLAGLSPCGVAEKSLPGIQQVHIFCDHMVDYISECHFRIINHIMHSFPEGSAITDRLMPEVLETTDSLLDFIDTYSNAENDDMLLALDQDLAQLGDTMETRFALEDKLLQTLYTYRIKRDESTEAVAAG
ncbi:sigma D regulator [Shewanella sp. C32]|uniref:Sigma D regulator n=1 Tax=Shewanella electrica TaxID=515560 RepID=A0ABT2FPS1_9GAMM|nr:sigma D regulator [Shewanella electrica]MCH1926758.1 sigma D regulator [Shewanella electrica]MCS4558318.1 sigma D regulator [Shewanella electrica]